MKRLLILMLVAAFVLSATALVGAELSSDNVNVTVNVNQKAKIIGIGNEVEWTTDPDFLGTDGHDYYEFFRDDFGIGYNTPITFTIESTGFNGEHYDLSNIVYYGVRDKSGDIYPRSPYVNFLSITPGTQDSIFLDRLAADNDGRHNLQLVGTWNASSEDWVNIIADEYEDTITLTIAGQ